MAEVRCNLCFNGTYFFEANLLSYLISYNTWQIPYLKLILFMKYKQGLNSSPLEGSEGTKARLGGDEAPESLEQCLQV